MSFRFDNFQRSIALTIMVGFCSLVNWNNCLAQDYGWWNNLVQWDGKSHWSEYLTYTPKFFGPNALPVPEIKSGILINRNELDMGLALHYSNGDNAQNLNTRLYLPIAQNKMGLELKLVPFELYQMSFSVRDERRARDFDGRGYALGDLHIATWIQLTKPTASVDILLTINLKTASGSNREATRYTDGSGYNFDLSFGKSITLQHESNYIRPYGQIGFYVWETNEDKNPQNDAFSFGAGVDYKFRKTLVSTQFGGYLGYKGNGDKPLVLRFNINQTLSDQLDMNIGSQLGFNDFQYNSLFLNVIKKW